MDVLSELQGNLGAGGIAQTDGSSPELDFDSDRQVLDPAEERVNNS